MSNKPYLEQPDLHVKAPHRAALLTYPGNFQEALRQAQADSSKTMFGVAQGIPSVYVTKILASTRPDFIWIDAEHGMWDRLALYDAIQAVQHHSEGKTLAIVRVDKHDSAALTTALDAGAAGIVIPHCESAQEVKDMYQKVNFPPLGDRSFCPWIFAPGVSDASLYSSDPFNMKLGNRHVAIIAQIESVKGLENLEEIAAAPGVASLMFGPNDFSSDAGIPLGVGGPPHPDLLAAMGRFSTIGAKYNKPLLGGVSSPDMVPMLIEGGYRVICMLFDNWGLANLVSGSVAKGREYAAQNVITKKVEDDVTMNGN
ncbi:Pyruvate/Phosphoenolpyruvate kinase-like domain-containing protein [Xylariales sp. PMI_506]|nr:Pyruvate/Phosphoenolpyruvate kinase-like domain-containing protein [Xylariales sp. PMI_506]